MQSQNPYPSLTSSVRGRPFIMYAPGGGGWVQDPIRISYLCNVKKVRTGGRGGQILPKKAYILNGRPLIVVSSSVVEKSYERTHSHIHITHIQ